METARNGKLAVYLRYFLLCFFVFLFLPDAFFRIPETGLDPSWNIAVHLMRKQGLVFGRDFVFTYGPLSIFQCRLPIAVNKYIYLLFDLYFVFTFFLTLKKIFSKHFSYGVAIFVFLAMITAMYQSELIWLFFFFLFNLFTFLQEPRKLLYPVQAGLISILCFYFKVNLGLVIIVFFVAGVGFAFFRKKIPAIVCGVMLVVYFSLIWISARCLHVDLRGYIAGSLQIIDGYNDAMFRVLEDKYLLFLFAALATILLMACWFVFRLTVFIWERKWTKHADELFIYAITAASVYIIFKSAFVRSDTHMYLYFKSLGLTGAILYLFSPAIPARKIAALCSWLVLAISFWAVNTLPGSFQPWRRILSFSFLPLKFQEIGRYWGEFRTYDSEMTRLDTLGHSPGNEYRSIIGAHSADIIPTEISTLYFNGIQYNPRPVMQSYSAYNLYLDSLNAHKYVSPDGPDYLLLSIDAIDGRYPFFDETRTKLAILGHYSVAGEIKNDLLLRKKNAEEMIPSGEQTTVFKLGENVPVRRSSDLQFARIFVKYNRWGQLCRLFYQPPALKITFTLGEGETKTFRAIVPILADGVILNKYIETEKEFQLLMQSNGRLNTDIRAIRLEADGSDSGFVSEIKMVSTWYSFPQKTPLEQTQDSIGLAKLLTDYNDFIPIPVDTTTLHTDSIVCGVGTFAAYSRVIKVDGWAFRARGKNDHIRVRAVLRSQDSGVVEMPSETQYRPDLPVVFGRSDLFYTGFKATVSKSRLPPGDYQFGVLIVDSVSGEKWIDYTDRHVFIHGDYHLRKINPVDTTADPRHTMSAALDPVIHRDDKTMLSGWAFVRKRTAEAMQTRLILQSKTASYEMNTDVTRRQDVAALFKEPGLEYCGFSAMITGDQLPDGRYSIAIKKISSGGKDSCIYFTGQQVTLGAPDVFIPTLFTELPSTGDIHTGIDYVRKEADTLAVAGWAVYKMDQVRNSPIDIVLKGDKRLYIAGSLPKKRPDVMAFFKGALDSDNCGFVAKIPTDGLPAGKYDLGVYVRPVDGKPAVKFIGQSIVIP